MSEKIVKYSNKFNAISTQGIGFSRTDYDLLFFMCMKAVERGSDKINITFSELKDATGIDAYKLSRNQMIDMLENFNTITQTAPVTLKDGLFFMGIKQI